jgi:lipopolysaccharide/colanic/teichoic acid biosynthesis glycosyltransferase
MIAVSYESVSERNRLKRSLPVPMSQAASLFQDIHSPEADPQLPPVSRSQPPARLIQESIKRVMDIVMAGVLLLLLSPLLLLIAILIKLTSKGPIFYRWKVTGRYGRPFMGYKFRTMFVGADELRDQLQDKNEMSGPFFKMRNDPRVTQLGRVLRRFSLDELPQLWSILKGDMSMVGPRPTQVFEFQSLEHWQKRRTEVRPGAVSSWIVTGKTFDFDEMVRLDIQYVDHASIWTDLKILTQTIPYVLLGKNY